MVEHNKIKLCFEVSHRGKLNKGAARSLDRQKNRRKLIKVNHSINILTAI